LHRGQHTPTKGGGKRIGRSRSPAPAVNHLTGLSRRSGLQQTLENAETQLGMYPLPGRHASKQIVTLRSSCNVVNLSRWSLCRKLSVDDIDDVNLGGTAGTFRAAESLCVRFTLSFRGPSLRVTDPRMMHTVRSVSMPRLAAELEPRLSGRADWKAAVARPTSWSACRPPWTSCRFSCAFAQLALRRVAASSSSRSGRLRAPASARPPRSTG
jgi:hypothetical protein